MEIDKIIVIISILIAVAGVIYGILASRRCDGKLKLSTIFLLGALVVFIIESTGSLLDVGNTLKGSLLLAIIKLVAIILIFLGIRNMREMICEVDFKIHPEKKSLKETKIKEKKLIKKEKRSPTDRRITKDGYLDLTK